MTHDCGCLKRVIDIDDFFITIMRDFEKTVKNLNEEEKTNLHDILIRELSEMTDSVQVGGARFRYFMAIFTGVKAAGVIASYIGTLGTKIINIVHSSRQTLREFLKSQYNRWAKI